MSKEIQGTPAQIRALLKKLKENAATEIPELGELETVPATTEGLFQRPTKVSTLKSMGEFDPKKFTPISVAQFPDGRQHTYDGDHRRHLWGMTYGYDTMIPAYIKEVDSEAEYHRLFASANGKDRKNLSPDEIFFHEYHGNVPEAVVDGKKLNQCGVCIKGSPDGGTVGPPKQPQVSIGGFRKSLQYDISNVVHAVATIKSEWAKDTRIQTELLSALALLFKTYPVLISVRQGAKIPTEFRGWFADHLSICQQKLKAREWKTRGGNVHHKATESVALGILKEFLSVNLPGGSSSKGKSLKQNLLKKLMESE